MNTSPIEPGSPEWESLREEIMADEALIIESTNAARDATLRQGDRFARLAPPGAGRGDRNGSMALLQQMATECGIAPRTAANRRDLASQIPAGGDLRRLLEEASDVTVSFETLRTVMSDDQPEALLARLIEEARTAGLGRITRDAARRQRGIQTGTVGTPEATAERIARDPDYARRVAEAVESNDDAAIALARAQNETEAARNTTKARQRYAKAQEAAEDEQVYHLRGFRALPVLWEAENLAEFIETKVVRDDEDLAYARNAGQWLQAIGRRIVAWADGETIPLDDADFAAEIEALLEAGA